jgi:hypothetical protein
MTMDPKTTTKSIPNRVTAKAVHTRMRTEGASPYELGCFYKAMLTRRLWTSHRDLAESLGASRSNVSKAVALARIPAEVVSAIGGSKQISFRIGKVLLHAIDRTGEAVFVSRVHEAVRVGYTAVDDVLEFAIFDRIPRSTPSMVRVRLARDKKSLRVEDPDLDQLLPHIQRLEAFISSSLRLFKAGLATDTTAGAETGRRRLRTNGLGPNAETMRNTGTTRAKDELGHVT